MLWFLCVLLVVIAGCYVFAPLYGKSGRGLEVDWGAETELELLLHRKEAVYADLRDLELEHKMGRLSEAEFQQLSAAYKNEAAIILERLDQLSAHENLEQLIEREIAARKKIIYSADMHKDSEACRCPSCGAEVIAGKKYCADCGYQLK